MKKWMKKFLIEYQRYKDSKASSVTPYIDQFISDYLRDHPLPQSDKEAELHRLLNVDWKSENDGYAAHIQDLYKKRDFARIFKLTGVNLHDHPLPLPTDDQVRAWAKEDSIGELTNEGEIGRIIGAKWALSQLEGKE